MLCLDIAAVLLTTISTSIFEQSLKYVQKQRQLFIVSTCHLLLQIKHKCAVEKKMYFSQYIPNDVLMNFTVDSDNEQDCTYCISIYL